MDDEDTCVTCSLSPQLPPSDVSSLSAPSLARPHKIRRVVRACLQCRSRKQRCLPRSPTAHANAPCQRCSGNGTTCSFETDQRPVEPELGPSRLSQLVVDLHQRYVSDVWGAGRRQLCG